MCIQGLCGVNMPGGRLLLHQVDKDSRGMDDEKPAHEAVQEIPEQRRREVG